MANKQAFISTTWKPGDIRYADLNGDGKIDRGNNRVGDSGDKKVIGNTTPRYNFNLNLSGSWKGFDLRLFFQGTMTVSYTHLDKNETSSSECFQLII